MIINVLLLRRTPALLREKITNESLSCDEPDKHSSVVDDGDKVLPERCVEKLLHPRVYADRVHNGLSLNVGKRKPLGVIYRRKSVLFQMP